MFKEIEPKLTDTELKTLEFEVKAPQALFGGMATYAIHREMPRVVEAAVGGLFLWQSFKGKVDHYTWGAVGGIAVRYGVDCLNRYFNKPI